MGKLREWSSLQEWGVLCSACYLGEVIIPQQ